jgi:hypothetical protein
MFQVDCDETVTPGTVVEELLSRSLGCIVTHRRDYVRRVATSYTCTCSMT